MHRGQRRHLEALIAQRRMRVFRQMTLYPADEFLAKRLRISRNRAPFCCNPRCRLCHGEKLSGEPSPRDRRRLLDLTDQFDA